MLRRRSVDHFFRRSNREGHAVESIKRVFGHDSEDERGGEGESVAGGGVFEPERTGIEGVADAEHLGVVGVNDSAVRLDFSNAVEFGIVEDEGEAGVICRNRG